MLKNISKKIILSLSAIFFTFTFTFASQSSGTIDSIYHFAKVCSDGTCTVGSTINFLPTTGVGISPITIDDTNGVDGNAWGSDLGWITFGRAGTTSVSVDPATGALSGFAWSQVSGWINFAPSGYGVTINSSGEFTGYAWTSGENGGWINFDCTGNAPATCVKTDWRPTSARTTTSSGGGGGGGGSIVTDPNNKYIDNSIYQLQGGLQSQKTDYSNDFRSDLDDSGKIDIFDYNLIMVDWSKKTTIDKNLSKVARCSTVGRGDVNCDGNVDLLDFNLVMVYWGQYVGQQGIDLKNKK